MTNDKKTPREQAEELYRKSQLMAEQDLDVYLGAKQRILDLLTIALTGWQLVPIEECRELAPGLYHVRLISGTYSQTHSSLMMHGVTHILNPSFGPLPEVVR